MKSQDIKFMRLTTCKVFTYMFLNNIKYKTDHT